MHVLLQSQRTVTLYSGFFLALFSWHGKGKQAGSWVRTRLGWFLHQSTSNIAQPETVLNDSVSRLIKCKKKQSVFFLVGGDIDCLALP